MSPALLGDSEPKAKVLRGVSRSVRESPKTHEQSPCYMANFSRLLGLPAPRIFFEEFLWTFWLWVRRLCLSTWRPVRCKRSIVFQWGFADEVFVLWLRVGLERGGWRGVGEGLGKSLGGGWATIGKGVGERLGKVWESLALYASKTCLKKNHNWHSLKSRRSLTINHMQQNASRGSWWDDYRQQHPTTREITELQPRDGNQTHWYGHMHVHGLTPPLHSSFHHAVLLDTHFLTTGPVASGLSPSKNNNGSRSPRQMPDNS